MFAGRLKSHHQLHNLMKISAVGRTDVTRYLYSLPPSAGEGVLYIHIPFCNKICSFCNMMRFLSPADDRYANLLIKEMKRYGAANYVRNLKIRAIYLGGGTPTALSAQALKSILVALKDHFQLPENAEITVESTITELTGEKLEILKEYGVNRLSIGVQTFSDPGRRILGRLGSGGEAYRKIQQIKSAGFDNVNIDIIYNYPHQTIEAVDEDLEKIFSLDLGSFSFYSLIAQPDTPFEHEDTASPERDMALFDRIYSCATANGFSILELTKLTRHDTYQYITARHGGADTIALGAGAGGNIGNMAYMNPFHLERYKDYVENEAAVNPGILMKESFKDITRLTGAIQQCQIPLKGYEPLYTYALIRILDQLAREEYLKKDGVDYAMTKKGIYWGNNICDLVLRNLNLEEKSKKGVI